MGGWSSLSLFEAALNVPAEEIELLFSERFLVPWAEHFLNPRRLRGSDFLMRWSQGRWAEELVVQAVNNTDRYFALPYGPSGTAPKNDIQEFERYFERLEKAGLGKMKRPDLLIFRADDSVEVQKFIDDLGGLTELPFTPENNPYMAGILARAVMAVECENSLWMAKKMPDYRKPLTPQRRLSGKLGLRKNAVVPTVILKEEDRKPLRSWQETHGIPVHIWHLFYDLAFGISFDDAERLITEGYIEATTQVFQAPGGATTRKDVYKIYYQHAYCLGEVVKTPRLVAASIIDENGHILPYVGFEGGKLALSSQAFEVLERAAQRNRERGR